MKKRLILKMMAFALITFTLAFCSQIQAAPLSELYNSGEVDGTPSATASVDVDGDGVNDIVCIKYTTSVSGGSVTSFKVVRGEAFTDLYSWVTPPGDLSVYGSTIDLDQDGDYETYIISVSTISTNQYEGKIIIYDALTGTQTWESEAFSITSSMLPMPPVFFGSPMNLIGTNDYEWMINLNEKDPDTSEETGKVMVYKKEPGSVGFSQLLWEQTYSGGFVYVYDTHYDLNRDGKLNLTVTFNPQEGSSSKGAVIIYQPSGLSSFTELTRFETSQSGNSLGVIHTESSTHELYPTRVDHGVTGGNLLFKESWTESSLKKNIIHAYRADAPYSQIGTYTYDGKSIATSPNDFDGDGWDELAIDYYDSDSSTSNVKVYKVQSGSFSLEQIWETGDTSGDYMIYSRWDTNQDNKTDLCVAWMPPSTDTASYGTLTFYKLEGSTFSQLYQFTSNFPGSEARFDIFESLDQRVAGPTEYLHVPVDLDCSSGNDLAIANSYQKYTYTSYEQDGKITIYNLPSNTVSWESDNYDYYLFGGRVVNVQSGPSNDLLFLGNKIEMSGSGFSYAGTIDVWSCGQTTGTTTTTTACTTTTTTDEETTTTTIDGSTTTTSTKKCPSQKIYGEDSKEVELLRYVRDNILNKTAEGQEIIRLYYQLSPAVVKAMENNQEFKEEVKGMIDGVLALITEEAN